MAQTIALQRGSTSITWNGTTITTLFTNTSSGAATRVIMGGISAYSTNNGPLTMGLYVKQAGTSNYVTVGLKSFGTGGGSHSLDFFAGTEIKPNQPISNANTAEAMGNPIYMVQGSANYAGAQDMSNTAIYYINAQAGLSSNRLSYEHYPQQFWIGPSDVVVMKFYNYNSSAATGAVAYNFVTVTET